MRLSVVCFSVAAMALACVAGAETAGFPQIAKGMYPAAPDTLAWGAGQNIVWKTAMPGPGNASPVVIGDRVFVTVEPDGLICVNKADGAILWQKSSPIAEALTAEQIEQGRANASKIAELKQQIQTLEREARGGQPGGRKGGRPGSEGKKGGPAADPEARKKAQELNKKIEPLQAELATLDITGLPPAHNDNGYASPTPFTDGQSVWVLFGTGVAACYDMNGARKWIRLIEKPRERWGHSASPVVAGGKVLIHIVNLVALDAQTGQEQWRAPVNYSWGSPQVETIGGVDVVITPKGDFVRLSDGKVLASGVFEMPWGTPLIHEGVIYALDEKGGVAVRMPPMAAEGMKPEIMWNCKPRKDRYYGTAAILGDLVYAAGGNGTKTLSVFERATGNLVYEKPLAFRSQRIYASVVTAGPYVFITSDGGETLVLEGGREYKEVARNSLEKYRSTPSLEGGRVYVRAQENLYCLGQTGAAAK